MHRYNQYKGLNQADFVIGERVKGVYFSYPFTGIIKAKTCVNNGANPAWVYGIELETEITTSLGPTTGIAYNDRDQLRLGNILELVK
jgi:hypothetical protein